ncbi:MAG TPA: PP0621 family protein [Burkholderiales bacterium]|nr:PP0621 family protein [Burkholderiales bacterium]
MGRLVVLIVLVVVAAWLLRRAWRANRAQEKSQSSPVPADLVACARCGMYLPRAEAREAGGRLYCGAEHARLGTGGS